MVIRSFKQIVNSSDSFNLEVILPVVHELLEIRLSRHDETTKHSELELDYARYDYIHEKDIKKEYWECFLLEKKNDKGIIPKNGTKLERVVNFVASTHYLFRVVTIKH